MHGGSCDGKRLMIPLSILTWPWSARAVTPPPPLPTCWNWPSTPMRWATAATGWPNTTTCPASPVATAVLIGHVAGGTLRIRVGAGGIMPPNHAPLQVAEQFGTLASLHPDRIDLGLGRAPGTDQPTARALRRYFDSADQFPQDARALHYFEPVSAGQAVQAVPGGALRVPTWILGPTCSARAWPRRWAPPAFASSHPTRWMKPCVYRREFRPSATLKPHAMALNVVASDSEAESRRLSPASSRVSSTCVVAGRARFRTDRRHRVLLGAARTGGGGARPAPCWAIQQRRASRVCRTAQARRADAHRQPVRPPRACARSN